MKASKTFWRLLGDYERLCTDEGVALREINLAALARLQCQKDVISKAITELAIEADTELHEASVENIKARQRQNLALAQEQLVRISCERQNLASASQRLDCVGKAYKHGSGKASKLAVEG
jgi:hypothetical protein